MRVFGAYARGAVVRVEGFGDGAVDWGLGWCLSSMVWTFMEEGERLGGEGEGGTNRKVGGFGHP